MAYLFLDKKRQFMEKKTIVCRFCGKKNKSNFCQTCGSISPCRDYSNNNVNAGFTDYSYNRYEKESVLFKLYTAWMKFNAHLFIDNAFLSKFFNLIFNFIIGGRPEIDMGKNEKFIDIGCGRGYFMKHLPKTWKVSGCDIVDYKNKEYNIMVGNFENMDFEEKYSIIRSSHSLEHSMYPKVFLDKIISITEKSGLIVISSPNADSLAYKIFKKRWTPYDIDSHFCMLNAKTLSDYLEKNNCKVLHKNSYTMFSAAGSVVDWLGIKKFNRVFFAVFIILLSPLSLAEFVINKADSFIIYAKKI